MYLLVLLLLLNNVNGLRFYGGFQLQRPTNWKGAQLNGFNEDEGILTLYHPVPQKSTYVPLLHRENPSSPWRLIDPQNFAQENINIGAGGIHKGPIPLNKLNLKHLDGTFFHAAIPIGKTKKRDHVVIQFIFSEDNWNIKSRREKDSLIPTGSKSHKNAQRYGDIRAWRYYFHRKHSIYPYRVIQGLNAKCYLNSVNVLMQGDEITDTELETLQEPFGEPITWEEAKGVTLIAAYLARKIRDKKSGVWDQTVTLEAITKRHFQFSIQFWNNNGVMEHISLYHITTKAEEAKVIYEQKWIGAMVTKLSDGKKYLLTGGTQDIPNGPGSYLVAIEFWMDIIANPIGDENKLFVGDKEDYGSSKPKIGHEYRYTTAAELWGFDFGEVITRLNDEDYYYDTRDENVLLVKGRSTYQLNTATGDYVMDEKKYKVPKTGELKVKVTKKVIVLDKKNHKPLTYSILKERPTFQALLSLSRVAEYKNAGNLPWNLAGINVFRPSHYWSYLNFGNDNWYNLDSGFGGSKIKHDFPAEKWSDVDGVREQMVDYLKTNDYEVWFVLRYPEFLPRAAAPEVGGVVPIINDPTPNVYSYYNMIMEMELALIIVVLGVIIVMCGCIIGFMVGIAFNKNAKKYIDIL